ncbi:palmitoyltransferase Akr1p [[Candida] anglica]|uniref:Palmitoyltransferase n=1 Tax=[Candida] anglica TaxID=148631 RepID=A0ABP0EBR5_9ASCO
MARKNKKKSPSPPAPSAQTSVTDIVSNTELDSLDVSKESNDTSEVEPINKIPDTSATLIPSSGTEPESLPSITNEVESLKSTDAIIETAKDDLNDVVPNELQEDDVQPAIVNPEQLEREANPELSRFMNACQKGELSVVQELVSNGSVTVTETFQDQVTGLHWAAINNRLSIVKYLCENEYSKADPNVKGGELDATPLHWACRNGLTYIVEYFICHTDADPSIRDAQSYNALHLAVHSSNILLVVYLVLQCCVTSSSTKKLYIDEPDSSNRTSLHWAAYQGDIFTVNTLLKFGADVGKVDNTLFIPLHWAFMRGHKSVLKSLTEAGSDIFIKNDKGKDSFEIAKDMNCYNTWVTVLKENGRSPKSNWEYKPSILDAKTAKLITFFFPYLLLPLVWKICSFNNGFAIPKIFFASVLAVAGVYFIQKLIIPSYFREGKALAKSPFLAGIFSSSLFWCTLTWLYNIVPTLFFKDFFANVILAVCIAVISRTFYKSMFMNPGFVPTPSDYNVILQQVKDLIQVGRFDTSNFCIESYVRKPLRSRYSKISGKLVARFDHYCPWVYNEIGVRNHKLFMTFVYSLSVAVAFYVYLSIEFFHKYEGGPNSGYDSDDDAQKCWLLSENMCIGYRHNNFHFNVVMWSLLQFIWIIFLELTQTFQIFKGITTWEFSLLNKQQEGSPDNMATLPRDFDGPTPSVTKPHRHNDGFKTMMRLIGLDQFVSTSKIFILSLLGNATTGNSQYSPLDNVGIPSDYGWKTNWLDFWFLGEYKWRNLFYLPIEGENNLNGKVVDYYKLYEYPAKSAEAVV